MLNKILKEKIDKRLLGEIIKKIIDANLVFLYEDKVNFYIRAIGENFDMFYLKTPRKFKSKKNNRPIIYRQDIKNKLLASYKHLSPQKLMSLIGQMVLIGKSDKLTRDERFISNFLKTPYKTPAVYTYYYQTKDKEIFSNIRLSRLKEKNIDKKEIKKIFLDHMYKLYKTYRFSYLLKKYNIKSQKDIKQNLENLKMNEEEAITMYKKIKKDKREVFSLTWLFKTQPTREQDLSNSVQLFEDEYQYFLEGIGIDFDDKFFYIENLFKFLGLKEEDYEYCGIIEKIEKYPLYK